MGRQNEVSTTTDVETLCELIACSFEFLGFSHEKIWGYHATIADDIDFLLVKNARGDGTQHKLLSIEMMV